MSHLVRLEGKHSTQNAHCAVWFGVLSRGVEQRGPGKGRSRHGPGYGESLGRDGDKIEGGGASFANAIR